MFDYLRLVGAAYLVWLIAFLPQFIDPAPPVGRQLVVMCAVTVMLAGLLDAVWGVTAGLSRAFLMRPRQNKMLGRLSGAVLIGGGLWLSLQGRLV